MVVRSFLLLLSFPLLVLTMMLELVLIVEVDVFIDEFIAEVVSIDADDKEELAPITNDDWVICDLMSDSLVNLTVTGIDVTVTVYAACYNPNEILGF